MPDRLQSGVPGLDEVLGGGLPANAINLLVGLPGTGKTLLAHKYVFENAQDDRSAVYLSTVSEPFEKIIRYGQTLSFFDVDAVGHRVFYEALGTTLLDGGLSAVLERMEQVVTRRDPRLLVLDSFKPFAELAGSRSEYRRFLHELAARSSIRPMTSLWLGEYGLNDLATAPEFAISDAVIWLSTGRYDEREIRMLQVLKLRGSSFRGGRHAYRLSADGMIVFPRLADPAEQEGYKLASRRRSSGVDELDPVVGQGYRIGSSTLVVGPSGTGKTVLGLHFTFEQAADASRTLFATFDENPSQIIDTASRLGWSFEESGVHLMYRSPVDLLLDEWVHELLSLVERHRIDRVFIDGLGALRLASHDPVRFREYLYSLVQRFARAGVTLMMSIESPELFGPARLSEVPLSQMADIILLLQFVRRDGDYRRTLTVLKTRGARTEPRLNEYTIGAQGIELQPTRAPGDRR